MIEQLKTIREALVLGIKAINHLGGAREAMPLHDAMPALTQLEAMVGKKEPKFWYRPVGDDGLYEGPVHNNSVGGKMLRDEKPGEWVPLFEGAAPVAQQPQATCKTCGRRMDDPAVIHGPDGCCPAQQPQAEPTDSMGIPLSCGKPLCSPGDHHPLCKLHKQPQAEPFGYVSQHTNGTWEFSPTPAGVYPDTAKSITAVYTKQPQAEAVPWDRLPGHLIDKYEGEVLTEELLQTAMFEVLQAAPQQADAVPQKFEETPPHIMEARGYVWIEPSEKTGWGGGWSLPTPQQAEAAPPDVVRDAERLDWLLMQVSGKEFRRIGVEYSGNCQRSDVDAAIAQQKGSSHE